MKSILYITDLYYQAKGRDYASEDLYITSLLKEHFNLLICHPQQAIDFVHVADMIIVRNSGPVIYYQEYFDEFLAAIDDPSIIIFNSMDGKADMHGKQYLLELTQNNFPVIPTTDNLDDLDVLGDAPHYVLKPKLGADSVGMKIVAKSAIAQHDLTDMLIQPFVSFSYEASFYFLNGKFQYALYAPDKKKRWELQELIPNDTDLAFAQQFITWNNMDWGIQRVDACRLPNSSWLLVELEDLNPFLSIDKLSETRRQEFMDNFIEAIKQQQEFLVVDKE
jgi:hypothetical protein